MVTNVCLGGEDLLQSGLFQKDYKGPTLRENLGLPRPVVG